MGESTTQIQVPTNLEKYTNSAADYLAALGHNDIGGLCTGATIFATVKSDHLLQQHEDVVLLVKRAADGGAMDGLWETPGGAAESDDPSVVQACAREVLEETGLHVTDFVAMLGQYTFTTRSKRQVLKLNFQTYVQEAPNWPLEPKDVPVKLDPSEHTDYVWASEKQVKDDEFPMTSSEQKDIILQGFAGRREVTHA